jgi:hypothetical protein
VKVVAYVTDLMDRSRFDGVGAEVVFVRNASQLSEKCDGADIVVLDLSKSDALDALGSLRDTRVIGFASHVDTPTIDAARAAGLTEVMPRSRFFSRIVQLLTH